MKQVKYQESYEDANGKIQWRNISNPDLSQSDTRIITTEKYCIELDRELRDDFLILHEDFEKEPTKEDILKLLEERDINFDPKYHSMKFYKV